MPDNPRIDAGALTTSLYMDAAQAIASTVVCAIDWNAEHGRALDELQKVNFVYAALLTSNDLEAKFTCAVVDALENAGVAPGGLGSFG
jgi:hypothetical protein